MIWDNPTALRIFFVLVASGFVSGCASIVHSTKSEFESAVDLSNANDVAIIRGVYTTAMAGYMSEDCWILEPGNARQITMNAGVVNITAACEGFDFFDPNNSTVNVKYLSFHFDALAGHEYAIKRYRGTFRLHDKTGRQKLRHCAKSKTDTCYTNSGGKDGRSTGASIALMNRALIMAGGAASNKGSCKPALMQNARGINGIYVDAGAITIYARCFDYLFGRPTSVAKFDFVAEVEHQYSFAASDEECIRLIDITDAEIVLACEPYKEAE